MMFFIWLLVAAVTALIIPASTLKELTVDDMHNAIAQVLEESPGFVSAIEKKTALGKRQVNLSRTLVATFQFTCPRYGLATRTFAWSATFDPETARVTMQNIANIDEWSRVAWLDSEFGAFWYHKVCAHGPGWRCEYTFQGFTQGEVTTRGVAMTLVTEANVLSALPKVTEFCIYYMPGPGDRHCARYQAADAARCTINHIAVHTAH